MKLFRWDVPCQACLVFSLFLSPAVWYTYKLTAWGIKWQKQEMKSYPFRMDSCCFSFLSFLPQFFRHSSDSV